MMYLLESLISLVLLGLVGYGISRLNNENKKV